MAWCRPGNKPLPEPVMIQYLLALWSHCNLMNHWWPRSMLAYGITRGYNEFESVWKLLWLSFMSSVSQQCLELYWVQLQGLPTGPNLLVPVGIGPVCQARGTRQPEGSHCKKKRLQHHVLNRTHFGLMTSSIFSICGPSWINMPLKWEKFHEI